MIRYITIGQYYKADSVIHRLDLELSLVGTLIFIISVVYGNEYMDICCCHGSIGGSY